MIPRIKYIKPLSGHRLYAEFDDGRKVNYDLTDDIATLPNYSMLTEIAGLFEQATLDTSRTIVYWNDLVDLPSDTIYEYGLSEQGEIVNGGTMSLYGLCVNHKANNFLDYVKAMKNEENTFLNQI